jgi:hypothetical protein
MTDYWPQFSAKELSELYISMLLWHAQRKSDLYKTGFVNEEVNPTRYYANASYNKHGHLFSNKSASSVAFPVLRYIDTYRINFVTDLSIGRSTDDKGISCISELVQQ